MVKFRHCHFPKYNPSSPPTPPKLKLDNTKGKEDVIKALKTYTEDHQKYQDQIYGELLTPEKLRAEQSKATIAYQKVG